MPIRDSILGCIIGGAIGDAAASAFEGSCANSPENLSWLDQVWQITDDTQLTLATCEAITPGKVDPAIIAENMLRWYRTKRIRGLGSSTLKALRDLAAGCHWALAGRKGDRAAGNGAAMRIAPLAFCTEPNTSEGRQLIRDVCRITHHNDEAYVGAVATVLAINWSGDAEHPILSRISSALPDSVVRDRLLSLAGSETKMSISEAAIKNGTSGFVADTVPLALFASQKAFKIGFAEMLEQIIKVGGDTDTIASIACQISGAGLGLSCLPSHLVERLPEKEMIMDVANSFADGILKTRV